MDFEKFLKQDLPTIKKTLTVEILKIKTEGLTIFAYYSYCRDLSVLKYLLKFCKINFPEIFLEGHTILSLLCSNAIMFPLIKPVAKYILNFSIKNVPYSFLEKWTEEDFDHNDEIVYRKYDLYSYTGGNDVTSFNYYILKFLDYNFPEISFKTKNFILPLLMEIQN